MNKTVMWTIIIYTIILLGIAYIYYNKNNEYKINIQTIENEYKIKNDLLMNDILYYKVQIMQLDSLISKNNVVIDSIKNKKYYEKIQYTSFSDISTDSIVSLFSGYNPK